ncbi:hypothetical protein SKAU_G00377020 [Synaphobranchus kaupii]|uniref:RGS domain-containing protein n=1 Tax=Synaphobranchus kaupii TaxID=118154 RepID=A0A9Q1IE97_SYNKA|nr:hypothetical protein SKAU_G00377020 [Synaphobranchus kaupii]
MVISPWVPSGWRCGSVRRRGQQDAASAVQAPPDPGNRGPNACCFCWCCCCSCSWNEEGNERNQRSSYETKTDGATACDQRPIPTAEEVLGWGQCFDKLMQCPAGRRARTFAGRAGTPAWTGTPPVDGNAAVEEKARLIYEDYVSILSPKEVSLDSRVREVINRNMQEPTVHTFDDAQLQIYTLMQRDSYPRYINSAAYKTLLQTVTEQAPES